MRCPWYLFHRLFCIWARTQGAHDPQLPGGPHKLSIRPWLCPITALVPICITPMPHISAHLSCLSV
ncbi:unnamed protein product, partial [Staurois parvus]